MFNLLSAKCGDELLAELERFITFWVGPREYHYGEPEESLARTQLPRPLRRLYQFAGRWQPDGSADYPNPPVHMFCAQDELLELGKLQTSPDGKLIFLSENQRLWRAATESHGEDPPVWAAERSESSWRLVSQSLSKFLVTYCLQELFFGSRFVLSDDDALRPMQERLATAQPLWLDGRYVTDGSYNFYWFENAYLVADFGCGRWISANSEPRVAFLKSLEDQILRITIETPSDWLLEIRADGSGSLFHLRFRAARAEIPVSVFDFPKLLAKLYETPGTAQFYNVFRLRFSPRPHASWPVAASDILRSIFAKALSCAVDATPIFFDTLRTRPLV